MSNLMPKPTKPPPSFFKKLRRRIAAWLMEYVGTALLRMLARSWRVTIVGQEHREDAQRPEGAPIWVVWHENIPASLLIHRGQNVRALVSHHHDGEMIARVTKRLGLGTVRGSSSAGGREALKEMISWRKDPWGFALTPDGPRGPRHLFAKGAILLSQAVQRPMLPSGYAASRFWRARSWDKMMIPKPFAKVVLAYGPPIQINKEQINTQEKLEAVQQMAAQALHDAGKEAERSLQALGD